MSEARTFPHEEIEARAIDRALAAIRRARLDAASKAATDANDSETAARALVASARIAEESGDAAGAAKRADEAGERPSAIRSLLRLAERAGDVDRALTSFAAGPNLPRARTAARRSS